MAQEEKFDDTEEIEEEDFEEYDYDDNDDEEDEDDDDELMEFLQDNPIEKMFTVRDELEHMLDICDQVYDLLGDIGPSSLNLVLLEKVKTFALNGLDFSDSCNEMMEMWSRYTSNDEENLCLTKCYKVINEIDAFICKIEEITENYVPVDGEMNIGKAEGFLVSAMAEAEYLF
jgi:hypothetical protein